MMLPYVLILSSLLLLSHCRVPLQGQDLGLCGIHRQAGSSLAPSKKGPGEGEKEEEEDDFYNYEDDEDDDEEAEESKDYTENGRRAQRVEEQQVQPETYLFASFKPS